jgi:chorismate mutase / prephenate dehydratase
MSKKLEDIRKKIDTLDDRIHDTLMERAALIMDIAEEKRKSNLHFVHPAREAQMIRRLLARHEGALPGAAIVRIWRELVGAVSLMQTGLKISVTETNPAFWDMARNYFGSVVSMQKSTNPLHALGSVREDESYFAVLPWPQDGDSNPWWMYLFTQAKSEHMKIVCALPYGTTEAETVMPESRALVVSKTDFASSGKDCSFIAFELDKGVSRTRIVDVLKGVKLNTLTLYSKSDAQGTSSFHLAEVDDYIGEGDARLGEISAKFDNTLMRIAVVGGYPVPPVYKKTAKPFVSKLKKAETA